MYRVNAVAPGPVNTELFRRECRQNPDQYWLDAQATYVNHIFRNQTGLTDRQQDCTEATCLTRGGRKEHPLSRQRIMERPCHRPDHKRRLWKSRQGNVDEARSSRVKSCVNSFGAGLIDMVAEGVASRLGGPQGW